MATKEYKKYQEIKPWAPSSKVIGPSQIIPQSSKLYPLLHHLYKETKEVYSQMPARKNGENPFLHPLNIIQILKDSGVTNEITLIAALIHDLVEEYVDLKKKELKLKNRTKRIEVLDKYEVEVEKRLERTINEICTQNGIGLDVSKELLEIVKVLTRHKRDFYYRSISQIFHHKNESVKKKAIQIKLADRTHNILTIQTFNNDKRTYACFKNLFILNNAKKFLLDAYGDHMSNTDKYHPTEILFKRCGKATYEAFLTIGHRCLAEGIGDIKAMIQLAFKKYAMEQHAVWELTKNNTKVIHLTRLFHGVIFKFDCRLHHEWAKFEKRTKEEVTYCTKFFKDYDFNEHQLKTIINYKDAYSLKEVVAYLLYLPDYYLKEFLVDNLTNRGRIKS